MAIRKRFIAGAKCPACQAQDSMAMWRENILISLNVLSVDSDARSRQRARDHVRKDATRTTQLDGWDEFE